MSHLTKLKNTGRRNIKNWKNASVKQFEYKQKRQTNEKTHTVYYSVQFIANIPINMYLYMKLRFVAKSGGDWSTSTRCLLSLRLTWWGCETHFAFTGPRRHAKNKTCMHGVHFLLSESPYSINVDFLWCSDWPHCSSLLPWARKCLHRASRVYRSHKLLGRLFVDTVKNTLSGFTHYSVFVSLWWT